jgi:hypothetical protein
MTIFYFFEVASAPVYAFVNSTMLSHCFVVALVIVNIITR